MEGKEESESQDGKTRRVNICEAEINYDSAIVENFTPFSSILTAYEMCARYEAFRCRSPKFSYLDELAYFLFSCDDERDWRFQMAKTILFAFATMQNAIYKTINSFYEERHPKNVNPLEFDSISHQHTPISIPSSQREGHDILHRAQQGIDLFRFISSF
jgi:hypothetical protein